MTLGQTQRAFTFCAGELIRWAYQNGYELTFGDAYRDPRLAELNALQGKGIKDSVHCHRLAVDLNLFKDGHYLTDSDAYKPLGEYWKSLHTLARWGGDFKSRDGNHFSFFYNGRS